MKTDNVTWHSAAIRRQHRQQQNGHGSAILWFTGLSGAGKSTLAHAVEERLHAVGCRTYVLDGDNVRHGLCGDLGFSVVDRSENIRRIGEVAKLMIDAGVITLTAFISPFRAHRERVRGMVMPGEFIEIYCQCALEVCEERDAKGLYRRARAGELEEFTGISSPYEPPLAAELVVDTANQPLETCVAQVLEYLGERQLFPHTLHPAAAPFGQAFMEWARDSLSRQDEGSLEKPPIKELARGSPSNGSALPGKKRAMPTRD